MYTRYYICRRLLYMEPLLCAFDSTGDSHRAKVPNLIMGKVEMPNVEYERSSRRFYEFNAKEGILATVGPIS